MINVELKGGVIGVVVPVALEEHLAFGFRPLLAGDQSGREQQQGQTHQ